MLCLDVICWHVLDCLAGILELEQSKSMGKCFFVLTCSRKLHKFSHLHSPQNRQPASKELQKCVVWLVLST